MPLNVRHIHWLKWALADENIRRNKYIFKVPPQTLLFMSCDNISQNSFTSMHVLCVLQSSSLLAAGEKNNLIHYYICEEWLMFSPLLSTEWALTTWMAEGCFLSLETSAAQQNGGVLHCKLSFLSLVPWVPCPLYLKGERTGSQTMSFASSSHHLFLKGTQKQTNNSIMT